VPTKGNGRGAAFPQEILERKVPIKPFENKNHYTSGKMLRLNICTMATKR
jgi:hypothetical protein